MEHLGESKSIVKSNNENSRGSLEHEYLFEEIPKGRPHSHPVPTPKEKKIFEDAKRHSTGSYGSRNSKDASSDFGISHKRLSKGVAPENEIGRYDLYKEAMYTCVHMLGTPTRERFPATQEEMCLYVHEIFSENQKEQDAIFDHVKNEPFPLTIVNARVKRAVGLHRSDDKNGFVDPYCIVTIETEDASVVFQLGRKDWQEFSTNSPARKSKELAQMRSKHLRPAGVNRLSQVYENVPEFIKTSVARHDSNPRWNQRFQCLALRPSVDKLTIEIWDHSIADKYVAEAIRNTEPSKTSDLDKSLKSEYANTERKKGDIYLGKVSIRVAEIPCDGLDHWFYLTLPSQSKDSQQHGKIRIQVWLVHAYRHGRHYVELAEPKIILALLWDWVLKKEREMSPDPINWDGSITSAATCFLFQYALQNGISEDTHAIIRWNAYAKLDLNLHAVENRLHDLNEVMEKHTEKPIEEAGPAVLPPIEEEVSVPPPEPSKVIPTPSQVDPSPSQTMPTQSRAPRKSPSPLPPLPPPRIRDSQADIEDNILQILMNKIIPIIRNHLNENVSNVHEALRSYHECLQILSKFDNSKLLEKVERLMLSAIRISILEWYQDVYNRTVPTHGDVQKSQYVAAVAKVLKEVNNLLGMATTKWNPEFFLIAELQYFPLAYDELQKMIIHDVEATCWIFFQLFGEYKQLRKILLGNEEKDKTLCKEFFELYVETQTFITAWVDHLPDGIKSYCCLEQYHRWFRPTLILWLGFALIRGSTMISKAITIDNTIQDNEHAMTSSSALDTANVFVQLIKFWETLHWPDIAEAYVIINFLTEVMCSYTVLYAEMKHAKLDREGYYDPRGRFTISERLCTALNNIEHVKEQVQNIPQEIQHDKLVQLLEESCGRSVIITSYQMRVKDRLAQTLHIVDKHLDEIIGSVGLLIKKEISSFIDESFRALMVVASEHVEDATEPIKAYLEDNIVTLQNALLPYNFHKMLQLLWNLVCNGIQIRSSAVSSLEDTDTQFIFFRKALRMIPSLEAYFEGGGAGLSKDEMNTEQFRSMFQILTYFTMETDELIRIYFHEKALYHLNYQGEANFGTIKLRVGHWNNKLSVEVISAADLTPHDEPMTVLKYFKKMYPTSDAMVELELRPMITFPNEKKHVTKVMWKNLNPTFDEKFDWNITLDDCLKPSAVLVVTVKDYDLLKKNAFLGETIIPLHSIPGISKNPVPQPMNLILHEVDPQNIILQVVQTRDWDKTAKAFCDDQLSRFVEPIIARKITK